MPKLWRALLPSSLLCASVRVGFLSFGAMVSNAKREEMSLNMLLPIARFNKKILLTLFFQGK